MGIIYIKNHQVLDLPFYICFPHHYKYLCGLATLEEDAVRASLGDCVGSDMGHFLGLGSHLA